MVLLGSTFDMYMTMSFNEPSDGTKTNVLPPRDSRDTVPGNGATTCKQMIYMYIFFVKMPKILLHIILQVHCKITYKENEHVGFFFSLNFKI